MSEAMMDPWFNVTQAAEYARCGTRAIRDAAKAGRLRAARVGGRAALKVRRSWLDAWLEGCAPVPVDRGDEHVHVAHA